MSENFKAWMERVTEEQEVKRSHVWDAWPKAAKSEIERVLAHNDSDGGPKISMKLVVERLRDRYEIETNVAALSSYCKKELNRQGWRK